MATRNTEIRKEETAKRLDRLISQFKVKWRNDSLDALIQKMEQIRQGQEEPVIRPFTLYLEVLESIQRSNEDPKAYASLVKFAEEFYQELFFLGEDTPDYEDTVAIFRTMTSAEGLASKGLYDRALFASFSDKKNYVTLVKTIAASTNAYSAVFTHIKKYGLEVREYLIDDMAYLAHLLRVSKRLALTKSTGMEAVIEEELLKVRRSNGLYDVDPVRLAQVEKNVNEAAATIECGKDVLQMMERKSKTMERLTDELAEKAEVFMQVTEEFINTKTENAKSELEAAANEYKEAQKKAVFMEKDLFLKQVFSEAEMELNRYKTQADTIAAKAAADMDGLSREADRVVQRMERIAKDDATIKKVLEKARKDDELMALVERLNAMKGADVEAFLTGRREPFPVAPMEMPTQGRPAPEMSGQMPFPGPRPSHREQRPIPAENPLLSRNVPFAERFALVMKEKKRRMAKGELFHEMFDDVITAVMENVNPYLIGPSGCGKTYMVKQIGEILNVECTDIGYINEEYDILGYVTAMGEYNESNFYRLYKYGGIAFCDELDNGNSKATVKLNSFLTNLEDAYYFFPGGERVDRHANFRVIAAGNTDGSGADVNYSTREKIEESVQQRMIPIYVDYDNRVEKEILKKYPDWFAFACAFRNATDQWEEACGMPAQGIFTTRDAYRIKQYMDNGSFTPEKIMNYEFVQTKEPEYLGFLKEALAKKIKPDSKAYGLYQMFVEQVDSIRKKGKRTSC